MEIQVTSNNKGYLLKGLVSEEDARWSERAILRIVIGQMAKELFDKFMAERGEAIFAALSPEKVAEMMKEMMGEKLLEAIKKP